MLRRAYSFLTVKSVDAPERRLAGLATTPATDRVGDSIDPLGVKFTNPMPLMLYHDSRKPIGQTMFGKATADGVPFEAQISKMDRPGVVQDRLNEAWDSLSADPPLIGAVSIGFRELEPPTYNKETGGWNFSQIEVLELSLVTIPANQEATIATIKSLDVGPSGSPVASTLPGASGSSRVVSTRRTLAMKKSYADMIADCVATRKEKTDKIDALLTKSGEAGVTLDQAEEEEHDTLADEVIAIDKQLERYRAAEEREKAAAKVVTGTDPDSGSRGRAPQIAVIERKLEPGIKFARYAMCVGMSRGSLSDALALAKAHYPDHPDIAQFIQKTAVGAGATVTSHWADDLVPYNILNDFIEYLRPGSIIGKFGTNGIPPLNKVPFNVRVSGFSAGLTGYWVGEGKPTPLSKATSFNTALTWAKVQAMSVLTKEEIRFSNPSAEAKVRDEIAKAVNARLDIDFVDPAKAAVANVSPASITNGVVATTPTGTTAAAFRKDLATLIGHFATNNLNPVDIVLIMSASMALQLSMMVNTLGNNDFPDITMNGGRLRGFPVIVSEYMTAVGSPSTQTIVAVKASDVYLADDGVVTVDASDQASVEMSDAPTQDGIAGSGASMVSLWQSGLMGLQATREINWKMRRSTAVGYISPAAYAT